MFEIEPVPAWSRTERRMEPAHALELAGLGVVRVSPVEAPDLWRIETDSKVGIVIGDGWELRIRPKLPIPKLLFLLAYSLRPDGWKELVTGFEETDELLDAVAAGFAWHLDQTLQQGPLSGYVTTDDRGPDLRGRVRFADQIAKSRGLPLPVEVTYDDFTIDITENRLLRAATEVVLRLPRIPPAARQRLLRARATLEDVTPLLSPRPIRAPLLTRLNARYAAPMSLAALVLNATSIDAGAGETKSTSFLFDMNEVFESFVFAALQDAFRSYSGEMRRHFLDFLDTDNEALQVQPDITWWRDGRCRAVIDAKYKSLVDRKTMPNADAYQMLAYCITLGLRRGLLIYAKGEAAPRTHLVKRHGYEIEVHAVDVTAEPLQLLSQIDRIASVLATRTPVGVAA